MFTEDIEEEKKYEDEDIEEINDEINEDIEEINEEINEEEELLDEEYTEINYNDDEDDDDDDSSFSYEEDNKEIKSFRKKKKITIPVLTKYEKTSILSIRSQQIMDNSPILIDISNIKNLTPYNIALEELKQKKIPFKIKRTLPDKTYEIWHIKDFKYIF